MVKGLGLTSKDEDWVEVMISFLTVLSPSLAKRMMKRRRMETERIPPVTVPYSASPLYLRKLVVWKRSTFLKR